MRRLGLRTALVALTATAALALAGCAGSPADQPSGSPAAQGGLSLAEVKKAGKIVFATEGTYRPFTYRAGGSGALTGYDVDVAKAVARELGVKAEFQETQFDAIFAGLDAKRFDVIANQISITPDRTKKYDFSTPYTVSTGVLVVPESSSIRSFADLKGKTAGQSLTSDFYQIAQDSGATVEQVEGWAQAIELLKQGRIDATVNDELTWLDSKKSGDTTGLKVVAKSPEKSRSAFTFRKGSESLVAAVDTALARLAADGTLSRLGEKYFGADVSR